jgi:competence protein ComEC
MILNNNNTKLWCIIFAISGLHIGIIAGILYFFLSRFLLLGWLRALLIIVPLFIFVEITGAKTPACRALGMSALCLVAPLLGRRNSLFATLIFSACVELLVSPASLWSLSFQLSYGVLASILLLGIPLGSHLGRKWDPYTFHTHPNKWARKRHKYYQNGILLLIITISAYLPSSLLLHPISHIFSPISLLLNMILMPILGVILCTGILMILTTMITANLGFISVLSIPFQYLTDIQMFLLTQCIEYSLKIPFSWVHFPCTVPTLNKFYSALFLISLLFVNKKSLLAKLSPFLLYFCYLFTITQTF